MLPRRAVENYASDAHPRSSARCAKCSWHRLSTAYAMRLGSGLKCVPWLHISEIDPAASLLRGGRSDCNCALGPRIRAYPPVSILRWSDRACTLRVPVSAASRRRSPWRPVRRARQGALTEIDAPPSAGAASRSVRCVRLAPGAVPGPAAVPVRAPLRGISRYAPRRDLRPEAGPELAREVDREARSRRLGQGAPGRRSNVPLRTV